MKPQRALFISDLHLRDSREQNAVLLLRFLDRVHQGGWTHLFLLGDIFDLWIADHRYFVERFSPVLEKLAELKARGIEIHYFEGNHDLDLRPCFAERMGFFVHEDPVVMTVAGMRLRIEHGDQMDPDDKDYLFLRWLLRTPAVRWLGRHLPGRLVQWIGETASRGSRKYTTGVRKSMDATVVEAKLLAHAERVFSSLPFDFLIAGHVHATLDRDLVMNGRAARVINLGTWLELPQVFELTHDRARLISIEKFMSEDTMSMTIPLGRGCRRGG